MRDEDVYHKYGKSKKLNRKEKHMKKEKLESKPQWREDRKVEKKFKKDKLNFDEF